MASVNKFIGIGNLTKDPTINYTKSGQAVASFTIACNEKWTKDGKKHEHVEYIRITAWGKLAEICGEYLNKGSSVYIEGKLQTREWEQDGNKRQTTEIVASQMTMLGSSSNNSNNSNNGPDDDEIPW